MRFPRWQNQPPSPANYTLSQCFSLAWTNISAIGSANLPLDPPRFHFIFFSALTTRSHCTRKNIAEPSRPSIRTEIPQVVKIRSVHPPRLSLEGHDGPIKYRSYGSDSWQRTALFNLSVGWMLLSVERLATAPLWSKNQWTLIIQLSGVKRIGSTRIRNPNYVSRCNKCVVLTMRFVTCYSFPIIFDLKLVMPPSICGGVTTELRGDPGRILVPARQG